MDYQMLVLDIDDTTIDSEGVLSEEVEQAIRQAMRKGVVVILATGRSFASMEKFYHMIQPESPVICYSGAQVVAQDKTLMLDRSVDGAQVLRVAKELGLHAHLYDEDKILYEKENQYAADYCKYFGVKGIADATLLEKENLRSPKALFSLEPDCVETYIPIIQKLLPDNVIRTSRTGFIEVHAKNASKGDALKFLIETMGIDPEQVIAIGDSEIDESMIEFAGLGLAVENATEAVKAVADEVVPSNDENGVAVAIKRYILEEAV